jgi:peptidoglycan/xylan/chitin deacetylase (PgdA/CDA1 family)
VASEFVNITGHFKSALLSLDEQLAERFSHAAAEKGTLLSFLFHGLFEGNQELRSGVCDPQQGITVEMFRAFLGHFCDGGYTFVSPSQIAQGLEPGDKYVLLTFDDGYFNNLRALPVMQEFRAPAVFFISTDHVREEKSFWWDAVFRENCKRGRTLAEIGRTVAAYKRWKTEEIEAHLQEQFGKHALRPNGDLDRPFTSSELHDFARHDLVHLGNHTANHAILTNYSLSEVREQIQHAQRAIQEMTGKNAQIISYPNGNTTPQIQQCARDLGLTIGVTVRPGKNRLPLKTQGAEQVTLRRITLWGNRAIDAQCRASRATFSFYQLVQGLRAKALAAFL